MKMQLKSWYRNDNTTITILLSDLIVKNNHTHNNSLFYTSPINILKKFPASSPIHLPIIKKKRLIKKKKTYYALCLRTLTSMWLVSPLLTNKKIILSEKHINLIVSLVLSINKKTRLNNNYEMIWKKKKTVTKTAWIVQMNNKIYKTIKLIQSHTVIESPPQAIFFFMSAQQKKNEQTLLTSITKKKKSI